MGNMIPEMFKAIESLLICVVLHKLTDKVLELKVWSHKH